MCGELVVPAVDDQLPLGEIADRLLPLVAVVEVPALDDAAAGEADEAGVQVLEQLPRSLRSPSGRFLPRVRREERDHVDVDRARAVEEHGETARRLRLLRHERYRVAFPRRADPVHARGSVDRSAVPPTTSPRSARGPFPTRRATTENTYDLPASTPMPRKPSFMTPNACAVGALSRR